MAGIDREVSDAGTRLGLAVGYDQVNLHDDLQGKFSSGVTRVGLYGAQPLGRFMLAGELSGGFANNSTTRQTGIGALRDDNTTDIVSGGLQGSTRFSLGPIMLDPAAGIRFATVNSGGISERAGGVLGAFAVSGDTPYYSSVQPYLSIVASRRFSTGDGIAVTPLASLGYQAELADRGQAADVVAADGTAFATEHNSLDGNAALLGLGISAGKAGWSVYANYAAHVAGNWTEQAGEIGVAAKF
jgi:outer membrane autotransporter protein